jgi:AcrR family transcriptional regulator
MTDSSTGRPKSEAKQEADRPRLTKRDWCEKGLDMLIELGGDLKIRRVAEALGVTYGAFYHHFSSADEFYRAILKYWRKHLIGGITREHLQHSDPSLALLMRTLVNRGLPDYDIAIRRWAKSYEPAAREVRKADAFRMGMVAKFLEKRGLDPESAKARGEMIVSMHIGTLEHPNPNRRRDTFGRFVEMADRVD